MPSPLAEEQPVAISERVRDSFKALHGDTSLIFRAPGRVNLIGEHTDYNDGFVMPVAIDFYTYAAVGRRTDRKLNIYSENFRQRVEFDLDTISPGRTGHWSDYVRGVAGALQSRGHRLSGANLLLQGGVPIGAGLSSSASVEVACALALLGNSSVTIDLVEVSLACQQAEHQYAGTMCGIMDQYVSCFAQANHALILDCRSLESESAPMPADVRIVVCNTKVKHSLASGEYNLRRKDCEASVKYLQQCLPDARALRDVTLADLERFKSGMSPVQYRRSRHIISENSRVHALATALKSGELQKIGSLMAESHNSLRDDYEVSCEELDVMVEIAQKLPGVYGSRMTGGGFGGCTVNLVRADAVQEFKTTMMSEYERATGIIPEVYICAAASGAGPAPELRNS